MLVINVYCNQWFDDYLRASTVTPLLGKFSALDSLLTKSGIQRGDINAAILDAGCSSMQLDTDHRGFSFLRDGPLDMRMDGQRYILIYFCNAGLSAICFLFKRILYDRNIESITAADVVNSLDAEDLETILSKFIIVVLTH